MFFIMPSFKVLLSYSTRLSRKLPSDIIDWQEGHWISDRFFMIAMHCAVQTTSSLGFAKDFISWMSFFSRQFKASSAAARIGRAFSSSPSASTRSLSITIDFLPRSISVCAASTARAFAMVWFS